MNVFRARIFTPLGSPFSTPDLRSTYAYFDDGYLAVADDGSIESIGDWQSRPHRLSEEPLVEFGENIIISPGFVDTHLHAPQLEMIGSYGGHLLEWLARYTFPTEAKFADEHYARSIGRALFDELLRNGTTTALIFSSVHARATGVLFEEAERRGFRAIIGKALMDRNAPENLLESAADAYENSRALILQWHKHEMLRYAISPRFAPTSTPELLEVAGTLKREFPDVYVHTHVSENRAEVDWVAELFPESGSYVDVYDRAGLLDQRSVLAHGVHLTDGELEVLSERQARLSHCPNSNLFLGSGLFPMNRVVKAGVVFGLGSDIGAGTTPSLFNAMSDAYKVQQVLGTSLSPFHLWYLATLGGAAALLLDAFTGSLERGKDADFVALDLNGSPLLARRTANASLIEDLLAGLIFLGDERIVSRTFIKGEEVSAR
ncbi:MAG: guanine deaminase [Acidobacteriota bacterium]